MITINKRRKSKSKLIGKVQVREQAKKMTPFKTPVIPTTRSQKIIQMSLKEHVQQPKMSKTMSRKPNISSKTEMQSKVKTSLRAKLCKTVPYGRTYDKSSVDSKLPELRRELLEYTNDVLGSGTFGTVYYGRYNSNIPVAIKEYKRNDVSEVRRETSLLLLLQKTGHHPNLLFCVGALTTTKPLALV